MTGRLTDLEWCLPYDESVWVERYSDGTYCVNHVFGDGGTQSDPYPTRAAARAAALELIHQRNIDLYGRPH